MTTKVLGFPQIDVLGIEMLDSRPLDGVSLLPLIAGKMQQRPRPIPFESGGQLALIDNRYKLITFTGTADERHMDGLHVVYGHVDRAEPSRSAAFVVNGTRFPLVPEQVLEPCAVPGTAAPEEWLARVERKVWTSSYASYGAWESSG